MSQAGPGDWISRVSESLRDHESTRVRWQATVPRYEIRGVLGRGGMGVIYRAWDPQLSREVALKVLPEREDDSAEARERFLREAQLAAQLTHPNIVPVYDAGEHEGRIYLAMQLIEGATLDKTPLDLRRALEAIRDAARAVHHAHERGIVHRDLKPGNILVDKQGQVFVADFGLARRVSSGATLTISGAVVGTPAYMPPEQARGQATDARSDVYSLGATLYEALCGRPAFQGANAMEVMKSVLLDEPPFPRRHNPKIPRDVEAIVVKAMSKAPAARYATAAELADDLDRVLRNEPVEAPMRGRLYRIRKKIFRHRWRVMAWTSICIIPVITVSLLLQLLDVSVDRHLAECDARIRTSDLPAARKALAKIAWLRWLRPGSIRSMTERLDLAEELDRDQKNRADLKEALQKAIDGDDFAAATDILNKLRRMRDEAFPSVEKMYKDAVATKSFRSHLGEHRYAEAVRILRELGNPPGLKNDLQLSWETWVEWLRDQGRADEALANLADLRSFDGNPRPRLTLSLWSRKFDIEFETLMNSARMGDVSSFGVLFTTLSGASFGEVSRRDERLGRAAFEIGGTLLDPAAAVLWLTRAETLGFKASRGTLHLIRGLAHVRLRQWPAARADYEAFVNLRAKGLATPRGFILLFRQLAQDSRAAGDSPEALRWLERALALDPCDAESLALQAITQHSARQPASGCLDILEKALRQNPGLTLNIDHDRIAEEYARDCAAAGLRELNRSERLKGYAAVIDRLKPLTQRLGDRPSPLFLEIGRLRRRLGDYEGALKEFDRAGVTAEVLRSRGLVEFLRGEHRKAEELFDRAIDMDPDDPISRFCRAKLRMNRDAYASADDDLELALRRDPSLTWARHLRVMVCTRLGKTEEALRLADEVLAPGRTLSEEESVAAGYEKRGLLPSEGLRELQSRAYMNRAKLRYEAKEWLKALDDATKGLEIDPQFHAARFTKAEALRKMGRFEDAWLEYHFIAKNSPDPKDQEDARRGMEKCERKERD